MSSNHSSEPGRSAGVVTACSARPLWRHSLTLGGQGAGSGRSLNFSASSRVACVSLAELHDRDPTATEEDDDACGDQDPLADELPAGRAREMAHSVLRSPVSDHQGEDEIEPPRASGLQDVVAEHVPILALSGMAAGRSAVTAVSALIRP